MQMIRFASWCTAMAVMCGPTLCAVSAQDDPRVPFFEAEQIARRVRENGRPVWTVYADNEGHGFAKRDNRDDLRAVCVVFLQQHLGLKLAEPLP